MRKIKSDRAVAYIDEHAQRVEEAILQLGNIAGDVLKNAIEIAEQDAEERAAEVLKHTLKHFDMTSIQRGAIGMLFEEQLNNGGQEDE